MWVLAQGGVFVGVGEEKDGGSAGAEASGHVVNGITDLCGPRRLKKEKEDFLDFVILTSEGKIKKRWWRRTRTKERTHHDHILGISQPPRGRNVQDAGRVRFRWAEAAGDDGGDLGVGEKGLQQVVDWATFGNTSTKGQELLFSPQRGESSVQR